MYDVQILENEQTVLVKLGPDFSIKHDMTAFVEESQRKFDSMLGPFCHIIDTREVNVSLGDVAEALAATASESPAYLKHPNLACLYVMSDDVLAEIGGQALRQTPSSNRGSGISKSVEEALAAIGDEFAPVY